MTALRGRNARTRQCTNERYCEAIEAIGHFHDGIPINALGWAEFEEKLQTHGLGDLIASEIFANQRDELPSGEFLPRTRLDEARTVASTWDDDDFPLHALLEAIDEAKTRSQALASICG